MNQLLKRLVREIRRRASVRSVHRKVHTYSTLWGKFPRPTHLLMLVPPKVSISNLVERLKGQASMKMFRNFRHLKKKPYWGNHFWAKGYYVDTVRLDADMIRKYVRYQEKQERQSEQLDLFY